MGSWYHGSKFALEVISDCVRFETAPFGINIIVIEPGPTDTEWGAIAARSLRSVSANSPYAAQAAALATRYDHSERSSRLTSSRAVADVIVGAATARRPKTLYAIGQARIAIAASRWLADRVYDRFIARAMGLTRRPVVEYS